MPLQTNHVQIEEIDHKLGLSRMAHEERLYCHQDISMPHLFYQSAIQKIVRNLSQPLTKAQNQKNLRPQ